MTAELSYPCSHCGKPVQFANRERQCIACRAAAADSSRYAALAELGIPPFLIGWFVRACGPYDGDGSEIGKKLEPGYRFEFEGLYLPPLLARYENRFWPTIALEDDRAEQLTIQIRRARLYYGDVPAFIEYRWPTGEGYTITACGLEQIHRQGDRDTLMEGMGLLHLFAPSGPGRRSHFDSPEEWIDAIANAILELFEPGKGKRPGRWPRASEVELLLLGVDQGGRRLRYNLKGKSTYTRILTAVRKEHPDLY